MPSTLASAAVAALAVTTLVGCAVHGLSFVEDTRLEIMSPEDRSTVQLPITVTWEVSPDLTIGPGADSFAVFVDRPPPPANRTPAWLFRDDPACQGTAAAACETTEFLAQRRVFVTTEPSITVDQVNDLTGADAARKFHELTVVLLDADGRRSGEGAWSVRFEADDGR